MGKRVEKPKVHVVSFRVTDEEMADVKFMAKLFNIPVGDLVRGSVFGPRGVCGGGDAA